MIYCYTGNGKGKTTAALGAALRALGYGWKVCIIQFMKGTWHTGELDSVANIEGIDLIQAGKGFYKILDDKLPEKEHREAVDHAVALIKEKVRGGHYQLIILDEVNIAANLGLLQEDVILEILKSAPEELHFILTGRNAPASFMELADLVTEMKEIKHPFQKGVQAVKGLDF